MSSARDLIRVAQLGSVNKHLYLWHCSPYPRLLHYNQYTTIDVNPSDCLSTRPRCNNIHFWGIYRRQTFRQDYWHIQLPPPIISLLYQVLAIQSQREACSHKRCKLVPPLYSYWRCSTRKSTNFTPRYLNKGASQEKLESNSPARTFFIWCFKTIRCR